ncbi:MAG TPA: hypothetical protein PLX23_03925 [Candidatus Hydrogenedens sp.]|nr:hypothetical protein [Candidatus Hydrogenedens sp.]
MRRCEYKVKGLMIMFAIVFIAILLFPISAIARKYMIEKGDWKKIYQLVSENRLPLLSKEEEEKVIQEVDKILNEKKSIYLAGLYLVKRVGSYEGGYIVYGNQRIKEKLVELMKMRIQCDLKDLITEKNKYIENVLKKCKEGDRKERKAYLREESKIWRLEKQLAELIEKDGDKCPKCYVQDEEAKKALSMSYDDEMLPGGYSWDIAAFYSVALSTLPKDIYEYLWAGMAGIYLVGDINYLWQSKMFDILFATVYAEQLLEDFEKGRYEGAVIFVNEWRGIRLTDVCNIVSVMKDMNPEFFEEEKVRIKKIFNTLSMSTINNCSVQREKMLKEMPTEGDEKIKDQWMSISSTYTYEIYTRNDILEIYEQIGEKEDIENIKKLAENIPLDYPVRETHKEYDEKNKNEYLQRVKEFQERVNALIEKLSM